MNPRGEFRTVHTALINGPDFQCLPERARALFLFLKLNFGAAGIEVWYPDELVARLVRQSGMAAQHISANLEILEHEGWIKRSDNIVWIVGQLDYDPYLNPNDAKHRKMIAKHVAGLPRCELVRLFVRSSEVWFRPEEGPSQGLGWAFSESVLPLRSPIPVPVPVPIPDPIPEPIPVPPKPSPAPRSADADGGDVVVLDKPPSDWAYVFAQDYNAASEGVISPGEVGKQVKPLYGKHPYPVVHAKWLWFVASPKREFGAAWFRKNFGAMGDPPPRTYSGALSPEDFKRLSA